MGLPSFASVNQTLGHVVSHICMENVCMAMCVAIRPPTFFGAGPDMFIFCILCRSVSFPGSICNRHARVVQQIFLCDATVVSCSTVFPCPSVCCSSLSQSSSWEDITFDTHRGDNKSWSNYSNYITCPVYVNPSYSQWDFGHVCFKPRELLVKYAAPLVQRGSVQF